MLLLSVLCLCFHPSYILAQKEPTKQMTETQTSPKDLEVRVLTSKNFASTINDGNVWLIEFYSPSCRHCLEFSSDYQQVASTFHSNPNTKIKVGKVNGQSELALRNRFGIIGYPTFYIVDGYSVYEFSGKRSKNNLIDFAKNGYKKDDPIPFWISPMGPLGIMQNALIKISLMAIDFVKYIEQVTGLSPILTSMIICGVAIFGGMISIVLFTIFTTPKAKSD